MVCAKVDEEEHGVKIMNKQDILIRNLKNLMNDYNLNQTQLAKRLCVSKVHLNQVLSGKRAFSLGFASKICDEFNISIEDFVKPDEKQFGIKEDTQESNKDAIMQLQRDQIERLELEIEELTKRVSMYELMQDEIKVQEASEEYQPKHAKERIEHPAHYNDEGAMECWDEMELVFGTEAVMYFCLLNVWKYRYRKKDDANEDFQKSNVYMKKYKELKEKLGNE